MTENINERDAFEDSARDQAQMLATCSSLFAASPDAMVISDAKGKILVVNAEAEKLFGYSPGELLGQPIEILVPPRFRNSHTGMRQEYAAHPRIRAIGKSPALAAVRKDGAELQVEITLSPLETPSGLCIASAIRDA